MMIIIGVAIVVEIVLTGIFYKCMNHGEIERIYSEYYYMSGMNLY